MDLNELETEARNQETLDIDRCSTIEIVEKINQEDRKVADVVERQKTAIAKIIDEASRRMGEGGRLIYMGAGTSGRLGVLDAAECPPTYGVSSNLVIGLIAGGEKAMFQAQEGAEDEESLGEQDLKDLDLNEKDTVIGLAASGRTPYVIGGLKYAKKVHAYTGSISCVSNAEISKYAMTAVEAVTGAECITGSTRMKAGTAEKMICNIISTGCMIRYGKVFENLMIDVQPTNEKLVERAKHIIAAAVHCDEKTGSELFEDSDHDVKTAILMGISGKDRDCARELLKKAHGNVHNAIVAASGDAA
jgi:N-acetylmuramic acid 6-phosphate etherase